MPAVSQHCRAPARATTAVRSAAAVDGLRGLESRYHFDVNRVSLLAAVFALTWVGLVDGQSGGPARPAATAAPIGQAPTAAAAPSSAAARAVLDQYCVTCHNARLKTANLLRDQLDLNHLSDHVDVAETVVRKVRAGLMPPTNARRPEPAAMQSLVTWMEGELDRTATTHLPAPGLHRLNRTEYTNAIRDLLSLEVDASKFL